MTYTFNAGIDAVLKARSDVQGASVALGGCARMLTLKRRTFPGQLMHYMLTTLALAVHFRMIT
jgi:hypothetical protein